jgi:hypothetical protein
MPGAWSYSASETWPEELPPSRSRSLRLVTTAQMNFDRQTIQ